MDREVTCCLNLKNFAKREKEKIVKNQVHSELQSHIASYQRSLHEREVLQERITQKLDQPRVHLQTEELMMQKVRGKLLSAHKSWRLLFKAKYRRNAQRVLPGKTS